MQANTATSAVIVTLDDLAELRRAEEERQQGKAPWRIAPDNAPAERDGPVTRVHLTTLINGTNSP